MLLSPFKNRKKTLIPTALWLLFDFLSLKNDVNVPVPSKSNKQKNFIKKFLVGILKVKSYKQKNFIKKFLVGILRVNDENSRIH
jgi:hypothetical protein